jgi:TonB family protein
MNIGNILSRLSLSPIPLLATLMLFALIWSCLSCQNNMHSTPKIQDAARAGDLAKVEAPIDISVDQTIPIGDVFAPPSVTRPFYISNQIHDAANAGDLKRVKVLLQDNPKLVFSRDYIHGFTPLHWANKEVAELLLANGAQVNARSSIGYTPLHWAAEKDHKDVVELLLAHDAVIDAKNNEGKTPLHLAVTNSHKDIVELLLANKANVNAKNVFGETPLDIAAFVGRKDVMELLRRHGGRNGIGKGTIIRDSARLYMAGEDGAEDPVLLVNPMPPYTEDARKARIEGFVVLQAVIRKNGTVDTFKVLKGLGYGLDDSAINTIATKWRFRPGTLEGKPVDVIVNLEVHFRMF